MVGIFVKTEKKLKFTRIQPSQNFNKNDNLFTQIYIEIVRLLSYRLDYERFEGILRLIKLKII